MKVAAITPPPPLPSEPAADGQNVVGAPPAAADGLSLVGPPPAAAPAEGAHAEAFGVAEKALTTALQTEVQNIVNQARGQMGTNPEHAIEMLRLEMEKIKQLPEVTPDAREQLVGTLQAALREGMRKKTEVEHIRQEEAERRAQGIEQQLVAQGLIRQQQTVKQLIDRVDFLLEEARFLEGDEMQAKFDDARLAAIRAREMMPQNPTPEGARLLAEIGGAYVSEMKVRAEIEKGYMDGLYTVNTSSVPFNDNKPIVYPDATLWRELTLSRKARSARAT